MSDAIKIALKASLVAVVTGMILSVFTVITFPVLDFTSLYTAVSKGLAIINYWTPATGQYWNFALVLMGVAVSLWTVRFALIAYRWIFKVNE